MSDSAIKDPPHASASPAQAEPLARKALPCVLAILFVLGLTAAVWGHRAIRASTAPRPIPQDPQCIVTLAPSVTETAFAVGLGPKIRGVTTYCRYPPAVLDIPKVAGFSDINVEAILRLRPDLVITPVDKKETQGELERLGLTVMPMDTRSLSGLREAIRDLGYATGHRADADRILGDFDAAVAFARRNALGKPRPRVLFSVMHSYAGLGYISQLTIAGQDGFFSELLEICGGVNAYEGALPFPTLSREAIMKLNPDVIIDLMRDEAEGREAAEGWKSLSNVAAIRDGRLYIFTDEADTVPGPRAYLTIRKIAAAIHPVGGETAALSAEGL